MHRNRSTSDPLGRSHRLKPSIAVALCAAGAIIGSAWPIHARSVKPAVDTFEGKPPTTITEPPPPPWKISDDTILSLATARAILSTGTVDPAAIAAEFLSVYRTTGIPGLGASTLKALRDLDAGVHWALAGRKGDQAAGNGAAMRIAPLAFFLDADNPTHRHTIRDVCRITHHNDEAHVGALAVLRAMQLQQPPNASPSETFSAIAAELPDTNVRDILLTLASLPTSSSSEQAAAVTGTSGYVANSVPLAIFIALNSSDLPAAILAAVRCGGDTDTIASMVGQILAARRHQLPSAWLEQIPSAGEISSL